MRAASSPQVLWGIANCMGVALAVALLLLIVLKEEVRVIRGFYMTKVLEILKNFLVQALLGYDL